MASLSWHEEPPRPERAKVFVFLPDGTPCELGHIPDVKELINEAETEFTKSMLFGDGEASDRTPVWDDSELAQSFVDRFLDQKEIEITLSTVEFPSDLKQAISKLSKDLDNLAALTEALRNIGRQGTSVIDIFNEVLEQIKGVEMDYERRSYQKRGKDPHQARPVNPKWSRGGRSCGHRHQRR